MSGNGNVSIIALIFAASCSGCRIVANSATSKSKFNVFGMCEIGSLPLSLQLDEGVGHAVELERLELVKGGR